MSNKNFPLEENEILSGDEEKICELLGNLQRVDAPKDFDFQLKARIANAKPQDFQAPRFFPILRYAAPLGLAIIILAVVVINGLYSFDDKSVATVIDNQDKPKVENLSSGNNSQPEEKVIAKDDSQAKTAENPTANLLYKEDKKEISPLIKEPRLVANALNPAVKNSKAAKNSGDSKDSAGTSPNILVPKEFSSNNPIQVKDVLSILGVEANFSDKKWTVKSVTQNSKAERSGVKANDIIEAIDGNNLSGETIPVAKTFNGNLTVVRGGKKMDIKLQNE